MRNTNNYLDFYSDPQARQAALEFAKQRQLAKRSEQEKSNAEKRILTKKQLRKDRKSEYKNSHNQLHQIDPNKKKREYKVLKDHLNPNSENRGVGRLLQWTGQAGRVKRFINRTNGGGNYSDNLDYNESVYSTSPQVLSDLEKDNLRINGLSKEVKVIELYEQTNRSKDKIYYNALDTIIEYNENNRKNKNKGGNPGSKKDRTYSAWELLNSFSS